MGRMSPAAIATVAHGAGFRGRELERAVAIALAESMGDPEAYGDLSLMNATWGPSVGLWQIRSLKAERGKGTWRDELKLRDPSFNAKAAYAISEGGRNWSPWSVYKSRAYILFWGPAKLGVAGMGSSEISGEVGGNRNNPLVPDVIEGPVDAAQATAAALGEVVKFPAKVLAWVSDRNNIIRMAKVGIGAGLVLVGLAIVARPAMVGAARGVGRVAGLAGPGKAARAVRT